MADLDRLAAAAWNDDGAMRVLVDYLLEQHGAAPEVTYELLERGARKWIGRRLAASRDPVAGRILLDALRERNPGVREVLENAEKQARRRYTSFVVYVHLNGPDAPVFATWPQGQAARKNPPKRYGYVEIYRTHDYRRPK